MLRVEAWAYGLGSVYCSFKRVLVSQALRLGS